MVDSLGLYWEHVEEAIKLLFEEGVLFVKLQQVGVTNKHTYSRHQQQKSSNNSNPDIRRACYHGNLVNQGGNHGGTMVTY